MMSGSSSVATAGGLSKDVRDGVLAGLFAYVAWGLMPAYFKFMAHVPPAVTAEQRTKEIGIRKVLGASVPSLVSLMSKEFSRLVILSFMIAAPAAWFLLNSYLDRYPIRVDLEWWIFGSVGLITLLFALLIVSNQAVRAAHANPVNSLRSE